MGKYHDEKIEIMRKYLGNKILKPPGVFESDEVTLLLLKECKVDEAIREEIINTQYKKHPNWNKTIKCTL